MLVAAVARLGGLARGAVPRRYRGWLFARACDPLSACARGAQAVLLLLERDAAAAGEEPSAAYYCGLSSTGHAALLAALDHEGLLLRHRDCTLALLTVREAQRRAAALRPEERCDSALAVLAAVEAWLCAEYPPPPPWAPVPERARLLVPKHLGHGMEYLQLCASTASASVGGRPAAVAVAGDGGTRSAAAPAWREDN